MEVIRIIFLLQLSNRNIISDDDVGLAVVMIACEELHTRVWVSEVIVAACLPNCGD